MYRQLLTKLPIGKFKSNTLKNVMQNRVVEWNKLPFEVIKVQALSIDLKTDLICTEKL